MNQFLVSDPGVRADIVCKLAEYRNVNKALLNDSSERFFEIGVVDSVLRVLSASRVAQEHVVTPLLSKECSRAYLSIAALHCLGRAILQPGLQGPLPTAALNGLDADPNLVLCNLLSEAVRQGLAIVELVLAGYLTSAQALIRVFWELTATATMITHKEESMKKFCNHEIDFSRGKTKRRSIFTRKELVAGVEQVFQQLSLEILNSKGKAIQAALYARYSSSVHSSAIRTTLNSAYSAKQFLAIQDNAREEFDTREESNLLTYLAHTGGITAAIILVAITHIHKYNIPEDNVAWDCACALYTCLVGKPGATQELATGEA